MITIIPQHTKIPQQDVATQPLQKASTHRDLNNNVQSNTRAVTPTPQQTPNAPTAQTTTRGKCDGTLHQLTHMGKSNSPVHQTSQGRIHPQPNGQNPENNTDNSAWELAQTRDPRGINNFHQNSNGKLVMASGGRPKCNYCEKPNHGRQRCAFRLADLEHNIDRQFHPQKGLLARNDAKNYVPTQNRHRSPMSVRLAKETDSSGHSRFWQTQGGHIIYSIDNQPQ